MNRKWLLSFALALGCQVVLLVLMQQHALGTVSSPGTVRCVRKSGAGGCYTTIQGAIDAATAGDVISVSAETYYEHVVMKNGVSVYGRGWANTVIDGQFSAGGPVVHITGVSASTVLSGVKVTHGGNHNLGDGQRGGGLKVTYGSPSIVNTWVDSCTAQYGGGVYVSSGSPTFDNVPVWSSKAQYGGGVYMTGNAEVSITGNPLVGTNGTVWWNRATSDGGGVYVSGATVEMVGVRIYWNTAYYGGGMCVNSTSNRVALWLNDISGNSATSMGVAGAGFYASSSTNLELVLNRIWANTAGGDGGGAIFGHSAGTVQSNWFIDNTSTGGRGGGAVVFGAATAGLALKGNWFEGNSAHSGGGLYLDTESAPLVDGNTFVTNTANSGAGIYAYQSGVALVTNNVLARNVDAGLGAGAGIAESPVQLVNNTIADNTGDGVWFTEAEGVRIVNNIISGNTGDGVERYTGDGTTTDYTVAYNDVYANGGLPYNNLVQGAGNLALNPQFVASGADLTAYYHIQGTSPIAETGSTSWAPARDIDGDLRILGGSVSMGADEIAVTEYDVYLPLVLKDH